MGGIYLGNALLTHSTVENIIQDNDFYIKADGNNINWVNKEVYTLNISEPTNFTLNDIFVAKQEYRDIILQIDNLDTNGVKITNYLVLESFNANTLINQFSNDNFIATINSNSTIILQKNIKAAVQPDWNQNDETASDYVKNRFGGYMTEGRIEILSETTATSGTELPDAGDFYPITDQKYMVVFDGIEYLCIGYDGAIGPYVGSLESEPFEFHYDALGEASSASCIYLYCNDNDEHTFSVYEIAEVPVSIDEKFLPDSVKVQPDWDQNDETALDYIKNRTHYADLRLSTVKVDNYTIITDENGQGGTIDYDYFDPDDPWSVMFNTDIQALIIDGNTYYGDVFFTGEGIYNDGHAVIFYDENNNIVGRIDATVITSWYFGVLTFSQFKPNSEITLSLYNVEETIIPLDEKFLPDTVATKEYVDSAIGAAIGGSY